MSTSPSSQWRVRARNIATDSENRIHDDEVARRYGFAGGLVPGIVVYGLLVRPVAEALGREWLARGTAEVRLVSPCYDGEEILVRALAAEPRSGEREAFDLSAERPDGTVCARGRAALPESAPDAVSLQTFPLVPMPRPKREASIDALPPGTELGSLVPDTADARWPAFARAIGDDLALWHDAPAVLHPGSFPGLANEILARSVALGPWIHAASEVEHLSLAGRDEPLGARGRVVESFARKGHEWVVLDVLVLAGTDRPVARVRHTAIVRPRVRA